MDGGAWQAAVRDLVRQGQPYCFKWRITRVGEDVEPPEPSYAAYAHSRSPGPEPVRPALRRGPGRERGREEGLVSPGMEGMEAAARPAGGSLQ